MLPPAGQVGAVHATGLAAAGWAQGPAGWVLLMSSPEKTRAAGVPDVVSLGTRGRGAPGSPQPRIHSLGQGLDAPSCFWRCRRRPQAAQGVVSQWWGGHSVPWTQPAHGHPPPSPQIAFPQRSSSSTHGKRNSQPAPLRKPLACSRPTVGVEMEAAHLGGGTWWERLRPRERTGHLAEGMAGPGPGRTRGSA